MNLYILRPVKDWEPWYDKAFGFVVRAESEPEARAFAQEKGGDETGHSWRDQNIPAWTDPALSSCDLLAADGEPGVIIQDFHAA